MPRRPLTAFVLVLLVACGSDSESQTRSAPPSTTSASPTTPTTPTTPTPSTTVASSTTSTSRPTPGSVPPGSTPPVVASGPESGDAVALTFDADLTPGMRQRLRDGRVDSYANMAVIEILETTDTPATIFFTGLWMEEYPEQTTAIAADPRFELATHSQTHRAFREGCYGLGVVPPGEMADEVRVPIEALARFSDRGTRYFRFPGLCHDDAAMAGIAPVGVTVVDGDSSGDAGGRSVDAIVEQTLGRAHPGSIIVMHLNGGDAAPLTDDALPQIIDGLRAKGLRPTTLSELLAGPGG